MKRRNAVPFTSANPRTRLLVFFSRVFLDKIPVCIDYNLEVLV